MNYQTLKDKAIDIVSMHTDDMFQIMQEEAERLIKEDGGEVVDVTGDISPGDHLKVESINEQLVDILVRQIIGATPPGTISYPPQEDEEVLRSTKDGFVVDHELKDIIIPEEMNPSDRVNWERCVIDCLSRRLDIPNGDAQGIYEVCDMRNTHLIDNLFERRCMPVAVAIMIDNNSKVKS